MEDVWKKLRFTGPAVLLDAPEAIAAAFETKGVSPSFDKRSKSVNTLVFVTSKKTLTRFLEKQLSHVEPDSLLWIAWPKGTSGIQTDINRDSLAALAETFGITPVTSISIDATWSALRLRPVGRVGK